MFLCRPVIFHSVPLIVPHLHDNCPKQTHFLNSHFKQLGPSFVQCVQVLVIMSICLFHLQLYTFKKEVLENAEWGRFFIDVGCFCLF